MDETAFNSLPLVLSRRGIASQGKDIPTSVFFCFLES
jgi:hypothetical protein